MASSKNLIALLTTPTIYKAVSGRPNITKFRKNFNKYNAMTVIKIKIPKIQNLIWCKKTPYGLAFLTKEQTFNSWKIWSILM